MRRVLAAAVVALLLGALAPIVSASVSTAGPPTVLDDALVAQLEEVAEDDRLTVLVHATSQHVAEQAIAAAGLEQLLVLESIGVPAAVGTPEQIRSLQRTPGVRYVEPDAPLRLFLDTAVEATRVSETRGETFVTDCPTANAEADEHATSPRAGEVTACESVGPFTGAGQSIAIVDSGVDGTHPMFTRPDGSSKVVRNLKIACAEIAPGCEPGESTDGLLVDAPTNDSDTMSAGGHGTHVASIAAGVASAYDGRVIEGVAPGADVVAISVGGGINILSADIALDWIARNHRNPCASAGGTCAPITVVNNSYGPDGGGEFNPHSATARITAELLADGVVMVWANGNGRLADTENRGGDGSENRSNPEGQNPLGGVISVANYDDGGTGTRDGILNRSSSRGSIDRDETWPDVSAPGTDITAACRITLTVCSTQEDDPDFGTIGGTSMAAPHVAGVVALLQEASLATTGDRLAPAAIEDILEDTAHRFAFGGEYGLDESNPTTPSSFDKGHGLVDAVRAITAVVSGTRGSSESPCMGLTGTDTTGEPQPYAVTLLTGPYDGAVDATASSLTADPVTGVVTYTLDVVELEDLPPVGGDGIYVAATFAAFGTTHTILAQRDATGATFLVDDVAATGSFDAATDRITVTATAATFEPDVTGDPFVGGVTTQIGRTVGVAVLWSDDVTTGCGTLTTGGEPPDSDTGTGTSGNTWFLHFAGECGGASDRLYMDRADTPGDMDACTNIDALPGGSWPADVPATEAIPAGTLVSGTIFVWTVEPRPIVLDLLLTADAGDVAATQSSVDVTFGIADALLGAWVPLTFEVETTREIAAGELLTFEATSLGPATVTFGYEADHASFFTFA